MRRYYGSVDDKGSNAFMIFAFLLGGPFTFGVTWIILFFHLLSDLNDRRTPPSRTRVNRTSQRG